MRSSFLRHFISGIVLALVAFGARAGGTLNWNTNRNSVSAQIQSTPLIKVLEGIAHATGWQVFVEESATRTVSVKFNNLASGDALSRLLGNLNYALVPETNSQPHLYVFRTSQANAKQLVRAVDLNAKKTAKKIPNELIVRLKPGANINDLAKKLGAKVIGRIDSLNAYRLEFGDEAAADAASAQLTGNSDVAEVDANYTVDPPPNPVTVAGGSAALPQLKLNPPANGSVPLTVGIVDTAIQPQGSDLDKVLVKTFSEAGSVNPDQTAPTHGTSVFDSLLTAATMAENGGSTSFQVANADVYGPNSTTTTFDLAKGVADLVNFGAKVINISSGGQADSPFLAQVIQQASADGVYFYAATGNDGSSQIDYPAMYSQVIPVTAGTKPGQLASYANYNPNVTTLMGPGTAYIPFGPSTWMFQGTSEASPFVAGWVVGLAGMTSTPDLAEAVQTVGNMKAFQPPAKK